ncbi:MAG: 4-hydroxy-tetrahydrodipicolinate synthase [Ferruginibacter sp.]|nr:4-hydroxy-tetrahydrodipicolinate synthase [Ferruginibacter sp.]
MEIKELLRGTGVAIITPFKENGDIDFDSLGNLIEYIIENGIEYIVSLGTTGETPVLSKREKIDIVNFTGTAISKRVPLVVGIGGNNTREVLEDLQDFPLQEAVAILSTSPYYSRPSQEGLFLHYMELAQASPKPILLYNVPSRTGRNLDADTVLRLAKASDNIIGIKEAGGDFSQCIRILKDCPSHFMVVSGDDALAMPQIACGMTGVISVAANAFPKAMSRMVQHALNSNFGDAKEVNDLLSDAYDLMFEENNPAGVKAFLSEQKLIKNVLRLPVSPVSTNLQHRIRTFMGESKLVHL